MMPTKEALTHAAHFLEEDGYKCRHCVPVAEFLSKLASGWVLVPGNAIAEVRNNNLYWLVDDSYEVTDGPLYAAAPKP